MRHGNARCIVLMTDFGLDDIYVGQMKGVILSITPAAQVIDLTHAITPQNIAQGAFLLGKSASFFPERSIFVSVVDPGVGTSRKAIAVETRKHTFLAPDNGLLTALLQTGEIKHCVHITKESYLLPTRSSTFHGRDVFSPAAAHLAAGVSLLELGEEIHPSTCAKIPLPTCHTPDGGKSWEGSVIYTDHFGNLVTSLDIEVLDRSKQWFVSIEQYKHLPLSVTYGDVGDKQPLAYVGSSGMIEIAVRNGNVAKMLGLKDGDLIRANSA